MGLGEGIHFDHDDNGFQEATGWITRGSGALMIDKNGDGRLDTGSELFGDVTILPNGVRAENGLAGLAYYDANGDGKIDSLDPIWSRLQIWQYAESDLELFDPDESGQISFLHEIGIAAIHLGSVISNSTDDEGNTEVRRGHFEWADGRTGTISEYRLQRDTGDTIPTKYTEIPLAVQALPDLDGHGNLCDLHQAIARDASGALKALDEAFTAELRVAGREAILDELMLKWAGAESVDPDSRGPFMDGRKIAFLERFYGEARGNPDAELAILWEDTYRELREMFYGSLMAQTHLKDLYDTISYTWNEEKQEYLIDTTALVAALQENLAADPEKGKEVLSEFARTRRSMGYFSENCFLSVREAFIQEDPSLGWVFDTGGLPVYDQLGQGDGWYPAHMWGTDNADAVRGSLTEGDGVINGMNGKDVIYGTDRNEVLYNETGDALLVGGGGNDVIWAGADNDILDGGAGRDTLYGEAGDDTYIFRRGSEQDAIIDSDATEGNTDTIWLGSNLTTDDVILRQVGANLVLRIIDTSDTLTVRDFFRNGSTLSRVERIQFMDGTVWTDSDMIARAYSPTEGDDVIYGWAGSDHLTEDEGDDNLDEQEESEDSGEHTELHRALGAHPHVRIASSVRSGGRWGMSRAATMGWRKVKKGRVQPKQSGALAGKFPGARASQSSGTNTSKRRSVRAPGIGDGPAMLVYSCSRTSEVA